jgi:cell division septation protein DedD
LTSHTPDDGFHEIQLNGKQLVFLFMAATVVSVVIFLSGVLVGRGVRAERGAIDSADLVDVPTIDETAATAGATSSDRLTAPPPATSGDTFTFVDRLEKTDPGLDELKQPKPAPEPRQTARTPEPAPAAAPPPAAVVPAPKPPVPNPAPASASTAPAPRPAVPATAGAKPGYAVQVAALNSRGQADAMVKRLSAKGYDAYVQPPADNAPAIFRVRVGKYATRSEAETAVSKLEKEGQFKPFVAAR